MVTQMSLPGLRHLAYRLKTLEWSHRKGDGMFFAMVVAKLARFATRLRGGGSAFPGLVLLTLQPRVLEKTLGALPGGVVFVTGSNGKSTTTAMLTSLLRHHGLRVFSNPAGGNLPQGLASAVVASASLTGLVKADIAVLEVDEAYGPHISGLLRPDWVVVTNIQLDQLNRFGEPEHVFDLIHTLSARAKKGVVVNSGDPNLVVLASRIHTAGLEANSVAMSQTATSRQAHGLVPAPLIFDDEVTLEGNTVATLVDCVGTVASVNVGGQVVDVAIAVPGLHYGVDAALAIGAASILLGGRLDSSATVDAFAAGQPVYGRGEVISYRGRELAITMQKNLPSLQVNLAAMTEPAERVWVAVDEGTPDPSWIFDADVSILDHVDVLTGTKAHQWALLLEYRGIPYGEIIENTQEALECITSLPHNNTPIRAIVNYEQMMLIRRLAGYKDLEGAA
jgi:UDP-N-acetylmuramyl tripeptide synthase